MSAPLSYGATAFADPDAEGRTRAQFMAVLACVLALKTALAAWLPFSGDEAFFYQWGVYPDWGYSDHPPMVGWWLAVLRQISEHPLALRAATVLISAVIALGLVDMARRLLPESRAASAWQAGTLYLLLPWTWLMVLVTTDTPLILFMALSAWCYLRADLSGRAGWYAAAGLCLGLAFLSKYFAVLLGLVFVVHVLGWRRDRWWALLLGVVCALPAVAVNLAYNVTHGWPNILFNVVNRNEGAAWSLAHWLSYLGMLAYLLTPWLLWQGLRARAIVRVPALTLLWALPLLVFALVAMRRSVGLHWVLGFVPMFVLWAALRVPTQSLSRSVRWTMLLGVPHLALVAALVAAPLSWLEGSRWQEKLVFLRHADEIVRQLERDLPDGATLMARAYSPAAMLAFHHRVYVPVFGVGRHHARQDDQLVDFRAYQGQAVRIFDSRAPSVEDYTPYFDTVRVTPLPLRGQTYYVVDGVGFRFEPYRERVLAEAARRFHQVPAGLPVLGSPFCERYGFSWCSPR